MPYLYPTTCPTPTLPYAPAKAAAISAAPLPCPPQAVHLLLKRGADPGRPNCDGLTAVALAEEKVMPEVYSLLLQATITQTADSALRQSEVRQAEGKRETEAAVHRAKEKIEEELHVSRGKGGRPGWVEGASDLLSAGRSCKNTEI